MKTLVVAFLAGLVGAAATIAQARPQLSEAEQTKVGQQGLDLLMDGDIDVAIKGFQKIQADDPGSPLGDLLEADATFP